MQINKKSVRCQRVSKKQSFFVVFYISSYSNIVALKNHLRNEYKDIGIPSTEIKDK